MKFIVHREDLLKPLQQVSAPLASRPPLPILGNLLLKVLDGRLSLTGTDLDIEMITSTPLSPPYEMGEVTVPARKFFDICRALPENSELLIALEGERILIRSGRSRFSLSTLPAKDFPNLDNWKSEVEFTLPKKMMKHLIEATHFSMAHQDVRYYLNGILFETEGGELRAIATDGHRLAFYSMPISSFLPKYSAIIPRKGGIELMRILDGSETPIRIQIGSNNIRVYLEDTIFTSKLVDGRFPDYQKALLKNTNKILEVGRLSLKRAFSRVSILSNEKFRGVHVNLGRNLIKITTNNLQQEEAEEILDVIYTGDHMEIGLNANYLLDVLNALKCENVRISFTNSVSGIQIEDAKGESAIYVIMPMKL